jgi:hypothetical protein
MPINVENTDKLTTTKNFLELSDYSKVEEYKLINWSIENQLILYIPEVKIRK